MKSNKYVFVDSKSGGLIETKELRNSGRYKEGEKISFWGHDKYLVVDNEEVKPNHYIVKVFKMKK